jgi:sugar phosphate isomerase/epimerase
MRKLNRRQFVGQASIGLSGAFALSQLPGLVTASGFNNIPLGFQSWSVRDMLAKDFASTLKTMADLGYKLVEMCSPKGYADSGFGSLVNVKTSDMRKTISDAGLNCPSCHFGLSELANDLEDRIQFAHDLGLTQMVCSSFGLPKTASLKDFQDSADKLNKAAEKIAAAGMQAGFHNHDFEFATIDGQLVYDALMSRLDPGLVKMQFQTSVINLGYKASTYFKKYPGRFISSHLSDWTADKKEVPIGQGVIDWKDFFAAAQTGGVKNFFVEMGFDKFKDSATYIRQLKS